MSRFFASFFAAWLAVCLLEPMQLRLCTMHGGLAIDTSATKVSHGTLGNHSTHQATHSHHDSDTGHHGDQCSCLGDCSAGNAPAAITSSELAVDFTVQASVEPGNVFEARPWHSAADLRLPFSNGPPTIS